MLWIWYTLRIRVGAPVQRGARLRAEMVHIEDTGFEPQRGLRLSATIEDIENNT